MPEGGRIFPDFTVFENLKIGSYSQRARKNFENNLDEAFDVFPILKERQLQIAGSLSGGERQMLAIARCLMSQPKLIMLDEPSSGLAPKIVKDVFGFIGNIKMRGYAILIVDQNIRQTADLTDLAYLLESGSIRFLGSKEDFINNPDIRKAYLGL